MTHHAGPIAADSVPPATFSSKCGKRFLFTLGALIVYRLGLQIPTPGVDLPSIMGLHGGLNSSTLALIERMSVFCLGIGPLFSILVAAEVLKLALPTTAVWFNASARHQETWNRYALLAALLLASTEAFGIAIGLEGIRRAGRTVVSDPGPAFEAKFVLTAIAGTAFLSWLADQITRHGFGSGIWMLLIAPTVAGLIKFPADIAKIKGLHLISSDEIMALGALVIAATALIVMLLSGRLISPTSSAAADGALEGQRFATPDILVWPSNIALNVAGILSGFAFAIEQWRDKINAQKHVFKTGTLSSALLIAGLIFVVTHLWATSHPRLEPREPRALILLSALTTSAICLAMDIVYWHYQLPLIDGGWIIAIVVVAVLALPENLTAIFERFVPPDPGPAPREPE